MSLTAPCIVESSVVARARPTGRTLLGWRSNERFMRMAVMPSGAGRDAMWFAGPTVFPRSIAFLPKDAYSVDRVLFQAVKHALYDRHAVVLPPYFP